MIGLAMGGYCATLCAPFIIPYLLASGASGLGARIGIFAQFLSGRLVAYIAIAVGAGLAGGAIEDVGSPRIKGILLVTASVGLIVFSAWCGLRKTCFCPGKGGSRLARSFPFMTGLVLGLNLCPPFVVALLRALDMADVGKSVGFFVSMFLGTTIYLIPAPFVVWLLASDAARRMGLYLGVLGGVWFLIRGLMLLQ